VALAKRPQTSSLTDFAGSDVMNLSDLGANGDFSNWIFTQYSIRTTQLNLCTRALMHYHGPSTKDHGLITGTLGHRRPGH
jgi:hypothetical protein